MRDAGDINVIESEAGVIASLIRNPSLAFLDDRLKPEHFTNRENRIMYSVLCDLANKDINESINAYIITQNLDDADNLSSEQIDDFIQQSGALARSDKEAYKLLAEKVRKVAFKRQLFLKLRECESLCFDNDVEEVETTVYEKLDRVMLDFDMGADLPEFKDMVDPLWEKIVARQNRDGAESRTIEFPFKRLNEYVVMDPGECICFAAPQKAGKSAMLLTCAVDFLRKGKSVLYIDSELSSELFEMRILAHMSGIQFGLIRSGKYCAEEAVLIENARNEIKTFKFIHKYSPFLDENSLLLMAKKAKHEIDMDVIILDYLKADSKDDQAYSVYASLGRISDTLKNKIAGDMGICALTAAQTTTSGKIADSAKIARNVSTVITITDKTIDEIETDGSGGATKKMRVLFNRNGEQMSGEDDYIDMKFNGSICKYEESEMQHVRNQPY